jgi:RNA polymerase sigma factor (sigma-70 family)
MAVEFKPEMLGLVAKIARQVNLRHPDFDFDDLYQEGCIGLLDGLKRAQQENKWKTYVSYAIKFNIMDYTRRQTLSCRNFRLEHASSEKILAKCEDNQLDLDLPIIRKKISALLTKKQQDTFEQYFLLGKTASEIAEERGNKTSQAVLEQTWIIKQVAIDLFREAA